MLRALYDWVVNALTVTREVEQLRREVRDTRAELFEVEKSLAVMQAQLDAGFASERAEREKFMLQVQNLLLQWERRLPKAKPVQRRSRRKRKG